MGTTARFCGECGKPLPVGASFCGECGAAVVQVTSHKQNRPPGSRVPLEATAKQSNASTQIEIPTRVSAASSKATSNKEGFLLLNASFSALQWGVIWLVGWLPVGVICSGIYRFDDNYYYDFAHVYLKAYVIGASLSGVAAGLFIYLTLKKQKSSLGLSGIVPVIAGAVIWVVGLLPLSLNFRDDDPLIIALPVLAILYGVLISRLSITQLEKKHCFTATTREKNIVAAWWVLSALAGATLIIARWAGLW